MRKAIETTRRRVLIGTAALGAIAVLPLTPAAAQEYPTGPVQLVVGYGPGGGTDTLARLIATPLSRELGQPVVVQNLPGGGGQVGAAAMLRDGADGSAILALNEPDLFLGTMLPSSQYAYPDLRVILVDLKDPRILLVRKDSEIADLDGFIARAKAEPGKLAVSVAQGSAQELFAKWLFGELGLDVRIVGYGGGGPAANAMLAGDVAATIGDDFARMNLRDESKALFVVSEKQSPRWPEAQPLAEALKPHGISLPSPDFLARYGIYAVSAKFKSDNPAGYAKLQKAMLAARNSPEFQEYVNKNGLSDLSVGKPGEEMEAALAADFAAIEKMAK